MRLSNDKLIPPMNRRQALRAMVGGVAALAVAHKASAAPVQAVQGIEVLPGQIGVLDTDGDSYAYWPDEIEMEELSQPRELLVSNFYLEYDAPFGTTTSFGGPATLFIEG